MTTRDDDDDVVSSDVSTPLPAREDSNDAATTPNDDVLDLDLSTGSLDDDAAEVSPRDEKNDEKNENDAMNVATAP